MLRQTMDNYEIRYGIRGHITSLKHFRPETGPDECEKYVLKKFEKGVKEVFDYAEIDGKPYFRFMAAMIAKRDCLKCHGHQGYKVGDVRGGVSVSVPMAPYLANQRRQTISYSISFILLWSLGFMDVSRIEQVIVYPIAKMDFEKGAAIIRISDITNEKMLQKQIVQTEKLSFLGFLVSGVAHEINNPNNFISFNIPILKEYLNKILPIIDDYAEKHENFELFGMTYPQFREDVLKLLDNIENGSSRITTAVSNLRGISRTKEKTHMDWINVKEVIEKSVSICRSKINRMVKSFEVSIPEEIPLIYTDSEAIETAVINLLINAAQAVDKDNSWIRLKVALDDSSQNDLIIDVSDNGCGIEEKIKNHIFDPFFTTKSPSEGTGLGLTLCHNSIRELGGRIALDSVAGKGSTFKVILPDNDIKKNEIG